MQKWVLKGVLSTILNVNPTCKQDIVNEMVGQICTFIKKTYDECCGKIDLFREKFPIAIQFLGCALSVVKKSVHNCGVSA